MSEEAGNVTPLGVRFKEPPGTDARSLEVVHDYRTCDHRWTPGTVQHVTYRIRPGETEVECGGCGTKLDPMWVLMQLAHRESSYREAAKRYQDEMARLDERKRTRCQHCGGMTRISRR